MKIWLHISFLLTFIQHLHMFNICKIWESFWMLTLYHWLRWATSKNLKRLHMLSMISVLEKNKYINIHCNDNCRSCICLVQVERRLIIRNIQWVFAVMTVWTAKKNVNICRVWVMITFISKNSDSIVIKN